MTIEEKVCSLELSKKLNELGVKQRSLFYWYYGMYDGINSEWKVIYGKDGLMPDRYSAFTSDELLEILPAFIDIKSNHPFNNFYLVIAKRPTKNIQYLAYYVCDSIPGEEINNPQFHIPSNLKAYDEKLANCLAKLLIFLIDNGFKEKMAWKKL